jgi:hypothetical protein
VTALIAAASLFAVMRGDDPLGAAYVYALAGVPVFPCRPGAKIIPLIEDWGKNASLDPEQITDWWCRWRDALIGTPAGSRSRLIVLDIDIKHGINGFDTLAKLGRAILPETPIAHSRSGGVHAYFAINPKVEIRGSQGRYGLGPGLDVIGEGYMIRLPDGRAYRWDPHQHIGNTPLMVAPGWLGHRRQRERPHSQNGGFDPRQVLDDACHAIRWAAPGERHAIINGQVFKIAALAAGGVIDEAFARHELRDAVWACIGSTGGDARKALRDAEDAWKDGLVRGRERRGTHAPRSVR